MDLIYFTVRSPLEMQAPCSLSLLMRTQHTSSSESVSPASNGTETGNLVSDAGADYPETPQPSKCAEL